MFLFTEGAVVIGLVLVGFEFGANATGAGEPLAKEATMSWRNGREAFVEGRPVYVGSSSSGEAGFSMPIGADALKMKVSGEMGGEVS